MKINHFLPFIPAKNFQESRNFYFDLGFEIIWEDEDLVRFRMGITEFFLQNFYHKELAENMMIHLNIDDFNQAFKVCENVVKKYGNAKIIKPKQEYYGLSFKLIGPSGELWDIVEGKHN